MSSFFGDEPYRWCGELIDGLNKIDEDLKNEAYRLWKSCGKIITDENLSKWK